MKYYILLLSAICLVTACFVDKVADETPAPTINEFRAEPISVNEGESVTLSLTGAGIESCILLENGQGLSVSLSLTNAYIHTPTRDTQYEVTCKGPGGEVSAQVSVNIILADDVVTADLLSEIGAQFDIEQIKARALEGYEGYELSDYSSQYNGSLPVPARNVISLAHETKVASFSLDDSLIYGYEGNLDTATYDQKCLESTNVASYLAKAELELKLDNSETPKSLVIEDSLHISDFEAVTRSLENPVPQGTVWNVSFGLSKTEIDYNEVHADYGEARGLFSIENGAVDVPAPTPLLGRRFPVGYPVPPAKDGYTYDPSHETCNTATPQVRQERVYVSPAEYCGPGSQFQGSLQCETGNGLPASWPYTYVWYINGQPMTDYVDKASSRRIVSGTGQISCSTMFPALVDAYSISQTWNISYPHAQWFVHDSRWPDCGGFNCSGKVMRNSASDSRYGNVEPASNYCIDRWKEDSWATYTNGILASCQDTQVFRDAVAAKQNQNAVDDMIRKCTVESDLCEELSKSLKKAVDSSLFASEIREHVEKVKRRFDDAKVAENSFIIETSDQYFSKQGDISKITTDLEAGYSALVSAHSLTGADWNEALKQMTGKVMPLGFQSASELQASINDYKTGLSIMGVISAIEITDHRCQWGAKGRFRTFNESMLLEIRNIEVEGASNKGEFTSIAPITVD